MKAAKTLIAAAAAAGAVFVPASPAAAATANLGQLAPVGSTGGCSGCSFFQVGNAAGSPSYTVPGGGPWTVTAWSARGGSINDSARLRIFRSTGVAGQFRLVAESTIEPIPAGSAPVHPVSIPVLAGDRIGLRTSGGAGDMPTIYNSTLLADVSAGVMGDLQFGQTVGPGGMYFYGSSNARFLNVAATISDPAKTVKKKCKRKKKKKKQGKPASAAKKKKKKKCKRKRKKKKS